MSTEETETEETTEIQETEEVSDAPKEEMSDMAMLETKITRFSNLRAVLAMKEDEWVKEHNEARKALLEEADLLERFLELDGELQAHRAQFKTNLDPINACIQVLSEYRMANIQGRAFEGMETLEKVWVFEDQVFNGVKKNVDETAEIISEEKEEKEEENSEE